MGWLGGVMRLAAHRVEFNVLAIGRKATGVPKNPGRLRSGRGLDCLRDLLASGCLSGP